MKNVIIIREFNNETDNVACQQLLHSSILAYTNSAFVTFLFKEVVLQIMVLLAAVSFIFLGLPIIICMATLPLVAILLYLCTYTTHVFKASEISESKPIKRWVAEAFEPYFMNAEPKDVKYGVFNENDYKSEEIDTSSFCSKIIGVVSTRDFIGLDNSLWMYGLAVDPKYFKKGIAKLLVRNVVDYAHQRQYDNVELVTTELQCEARLLFLQEGFQMKQIYHRPILGLVSLGKFHQILKIKHDFN